MMKVKLINYTKEPLRTLAMATLVSYWDKWSLDRLEDITEKDAEMHIPKVLGYGHESILEHVNLNFAVEGVSVVTLKQITRHRHMSFTVRSQRYIKEDYPKFVIPETVKRVAEENEEHLLSFNHPGESSIDAIFTTKDVKEFFEKAKRLYYTMLNSGVPPEDARFILPQAIETKFVVTMNFREFKHFIGLRMCERAQWEIRELAQRMWEEVFKVPELRKLMIWAKVGPKCISLGYCPEGELMPRGCLQRQRKWWREITKEGVD